MQSIRRSSLSPPFIPLTLTLILGQFCNFMHLRRPPVTLIRELQTAQRLERRVDPSGPVAAEKKAREAARKLRGVVVEESPALAQAV